MGAMLPILSYLGIPTYSLPTALVSNTLNYGKFNIQDTTEYIKGTLPVWKELGFSFDAICTGLMFSEEQAKLVASYCEEQGKNGTIVFVDPILGDGGQLYNGVTERQVELMREMVSVADLTFPNYTEACYLTGTRIKSGSISWEEAGDLLDKLRDMGSKSALITSCKIDGHNSIFSAVLIGHLLNGEPLKGSTRQAMDTVFRMIDRYSDTDDKNRGIPVEKCLDLLSLEDDLGER